MSSCAVDEDDIPYATVSQNIRNLCRLQFTLSTFSNFPYVIGATASRHCRSRRYTNKQAADTVGLLIERYYLSRIARSAIGTVDRFVLPRSL